MGGILIAKGGEGAPRVGGQGQVSLYIAHSEVGCLRCGQLAEM